MPRLPCGRILVAQFMYGGGADTDEGDPAMVYEVPVEQYRREYTFLAPATYAHTKSSRDSVACRLGGR